jgi:hypothetical protein
MKSFKSFYEAMTFKVDVEGLPVMYVDGNSPGEVKNHLRKLVKQPSMIKSVKRQTKHDVKKMYRDKAQGKEVAEMTQQSKTHPNLKIAVGKSAQSVKDTKARADKRKANKQGTSLAAGTSGEVDYGTDQSIKIMKKKTPGETQEGNGLWANIHAKRRRGEKMRKKGAKGAPTAAAIKSAQKEEVSEKITIGKIRRAAYKTGKALGDVQAVKKNKVARRVKNRIVGKLAAKALSGLFK